MPTYGVKQQVAQPQQPTGVVTTGLGRGLLLAANFGAGVFDQTVFRRPLTVNGTLTKIATQAGIGVGGFSSSNYIGFNNPINGDNTGGNAAGSVFALVRNATTNNQGFWTLTSAGGSNNQDHLPFSNLIYTTALANGRWANGIPVPRGVSSLLLPTSVCITRSASLFQVSSSVCSLFVNNIFVTSASVNLPPINSAFRLGSNSQTSEAYSGAFLMFAMWDRALTRAEVTALHNNPWQIFVRPTKSIYIQRASPTLSAATVTNITQTTAKPQVVATF